MARALKPLKGWLRRKAQSEDGTATIPFLMFMPLFLMLVTSSVEMGLLMIRHVMLERSLDMAVRDLRLGAWNPPPDATQIKKRVCNGAGLIPDCMNVMAVELRRVSKATWSPLSAGAMCTNRDDLITADDNYIFNGSSNDLMLIRVCVKFKPIFPMTGLGAQMPKDPSGEYALVSSTAFVNEPIPGVN